MSARDELMAAIDFDRAAEASKWFCQPDDLRDSVHSEQRHPDW